jgi:hypothetical protein
MNSSILIPALFQRTTSVFRSCYSRKVTVANHIVAGIEEAAHPGMVDALSNDIDTAECSLKELGYGD